MNAISVIDGGTAWSVEQGDCLGWLRSLPDDSVDLLFTSPPYELARTYGIGEKMVGGQAWVDWMVEVVRAASPKVKGLIGINCEGQTKDYSYTGTPFILFTDLHRAGFNLRRPAFFHRIGIPGSGGPDWLRADVEPVICVTREGKLPWSDNTACGHPPKWAPGGEMSNRLTSGMRLNQWGKTGSNTGTTATGNKEKSTAGKPRPSHRTVTVPKGTATRGKKNGDTVTAPGHYDSPSIANPGNVIQERYTADEVARLLAQAGDISHHVVGGGAMGHASAHRNEAPFPLTLPEFFIKSFCPPGGLVADCFAGSGTTIHAAIENGRRGIGCDVRESQVVLTRRRLATVTAPIPGF